MNVAAVALQRRLTKEIKLHGGNELDARMALIGEFQDKLARMRNTPNVPLRRTIGEALLFALWEPIIPRLMEIGREWGIEIDEAVFRQPGRCKRPPAGRRRRSATSEARGPGDTRSAPEAWLA